MLFWWYDRKNNPAVIQKLAARANRKNGIYSESETDSAEKKSSGIQIIKSKGAVAGTELSSDAKENASPKTDTEPAEAKKSGTESETAVFTEKELTDVSINETKPKNTNSAKKKKKKK